MSDAAEALEAARQQAAADLAAAEAAAEELRRVVDQAAQTQK